MKCILNIFIKNYYITNFLLTDFLIFLCPNQYLFSFLNVIKEFELIFKHFIYNFIF